MRVFYYKRYSFPNSATVKLMTVYKEQEMIRIVIKIVLFILPTGFMTGLLAAIVIYPASTADRITAALWLGLSAPAFIASLSMLKDK